MDTQIKLTINSFHIDKEGKRSNYNSESTSLIKIDESDIIFNIDETENISLIFDFDPLKYSVEVESAETGELIEMIPNVEFDFHMSGEPNSFFPGYFDILISRNGETKKCFFCVNPKQMKMETVLYLRSYVNEFYDGLSLDLDKKRKMNYSLEDDDTSFSSFSNSSFLEHNFPNVVNYMNKYVNSRYEQLSTKEIVGPRFSKIDHKSVKWLANKGFVYNKNLNRPSIMLTKKTVFTLDNEQNRIFKSYVVFWDGELNNQITKLVEYQKEQTSRLEQNKKDLLKLQNEIDKISNIKTISKHAKKRMEGKADEIKVNIKSLQDRLHFYQERYEKIKRYKTFVENVRYNSWVSFIREEPNYLYKRITINELLLIKEIKDRYIGIKRRVSFSNNKKIDYFAEKDTPKLFETYLYILLINIVRSHGYDIDEKMLPLGDLMYTLSHPSKVILSCDSGKTCEIIYDNLLQNASKVYIESNYCVISGSHNRPDFILTFKDETGELIDSVVVEAKWRKLENIYNEYGDTDVMISLKDYSNLCYYDANTKKFKRGIISKVIALYPDCKERINNSLINLISFYGLNVCEEIESTKNYRLLDSVISSFL